MLTNQPLSDTMTQRISKAFDDRMKEYNDTVNRVVSKALDAHTEGHSADKVNDTLETFARFYGIEPIDCRIRFDRVLTALNA